MTNLFLDLAVALGCAVIFGLICIVFAFTWWVIRILCQTGKEVSKGCSPAKDVPIDMSAVTNYAKNTDENEPSTTE